jgi:2-oxoglutarate ferredoxin oxidoreductase subunit alpha
MRGKGASVPTTTKRIQLLQGNEACAEGALAAGCRFFAGYPISPSSEIAEYLSVQLPRVGGVFLQMEDEIAAMAAVIGASLAGRKVLTATSGPGFSLKQENIGFAAMTEVPCVVVDVMRGGPSTGLPTSPAQADVMQARWGTHGDHPVIALVPASVREAFFETVRAFNLAERFRVPVMLLMDEVVAHMREPVELPDPGALELWERPRPTGPPETYLPYEDTPSGVPPMADFGTGYRYHVTGLVHDQRGLPKDGPGVVDALLRRLLRKLELAREDIDRFELTGTDDAEVLLVAYGAVARSARAALREARAAGRKVGLFRPLTLWPFPESHLEKLSRDRRAIVVAEMNAGQIALEVERAVRGQCPVYRVNRIDGEPIAPAEILRGIKEAA